MTLYDKFNGANLGEFLSIKENRFLTEYFLEKCMQLSEDT